MKTHLIAILILLSFASSAQERSYSSKLTSSIYKALDRHFECCVDSLPSRVAVLKFTESYLVKDSSCVDLNFVYSQMLDEETSDMYAEEFHEKLLKRDKRFRRKKYTRSCSEVIPSVQSISQSGSYLKIVTKFTVNLYFQ